MNDKALRKIVIVGGGIAGWMAAAPLALKLRRGDGTPCETVLVESSATAAPGEGEAALPAIRAFNRGLGLESSFISILVGRGVEPRSRDPFIDRMDERALRAHFARVRSAIPGSVAAMPDHADYIARHACAEPAIAAAPPAAMDYTALPLGSGTASNDRRRHTAGQPSPSNA